ncbi:hypothetical protein CFP56_022823 [Quercus suber]|uniref:Uncharacterized protein n=1 Tax=Quercus suber TaxID=58331 RepID=A0AAW0KBS8_QUESU
MKGIYQSTDHVSDVLLHISLLHSAEEEKRKQLNCSPFQCRKFGIIGFPFTNSAEPNCCLLPENYEKTPPTIQLRWSEDHMKL